MEHSAIFNDHKESMETRLENLEALLGESTERHAKELENAKKKLGSLDSALSKCADAKHHSSLQERVAYLEQTIGDSVDDHTQHKNSIDGRLDGIDRKLRDLGTSIDSKGHKSEIEKLEGIVLAGIEKRLTVVEEKHLQDFIKRLTDYEKKHMQEFDDMKSRIGEIDRGLKDCANIEHCLGLDRKHGALSQQQVEITESMRTRMQEVTNKIEAQSMTINSVKMFLEQRLSQVESKTGDGLGGSALFEQLEQRYQYMQEEQKRARDILESSMLEQIRLEHSTVHSQANQIKEQWDREMKARQAYQENYKELLGQERANREAQESQTEQRLEAFERSMYAELQRVWHEFGKETRVDGKTVSIPHSPPRTVSPVRSATIAVQPQPTYTIREGYTVVPNVIQEGYMAVPNVQEYLTPRLEGISLTSPRLGMTSRVSSVPSVPPSPLQSYVSGTRDVGSSVRSGTPIRLGQMVLDGSKSQSLLSQGGSISVQQRPQGSMMSYESIPGSGIYSTSTFGSILESQ
jgi:hypothetical protein